MSTADDIERIERDRKSRERGLLLWFLSLADKAKRYVNRAVRVGAAWAPMLRGVLLGNEALDLVGGVPVLTRGMLDSHKAGVRRVGRLVGVPVDDAVSAVVIARYEAEAMQQIERVRNTLETNIAQRLAEAEQADRIAADVRAVSEALRTAGWAPDASHNAKAESSAAVLRSYATGMGEGFKQPTVAAVTTALRFRAVLDASTTSICRARNGVTLPPGHPWWNGQYPPLHFSCRSLVLPLTGENVKFTENPPTFPPAEMGWGQYAGFLSNAAYA